jgi:hypothetical protein
MKIGLMVLTGVVMGSISLQASVATLTVTGWGTGVAGNSNISPYTGNYVDPNSIATNGIKLYCDDAADPSKGIGSTYNVTETSLLSVNSTDSRFYGLAANRTDSWAPWNDQVTLPTGTTLYEELAWLYQQMTDTTNGTILTDIQNAAWDLTNTASEFGDQTTAAALWIKEANLDAISQSAGSFNDGSGNGSVTLSTAVYANWYVIDGATGVSGSWQEFLSDSTLNHTGGQGGTPEPATFGLLAGALLAGGVYGRRKAKK